MMSAFDKRIQEIARLAFDKILQITQSSKGTDAARALAVIERIAVAIRSGFARKIDPATLLKTIELEHKTLTEQLFANKATVRSELDKKFPT